MQKETPVCQWQSGGYMAVRSYLPWGKQRRVIALAEANRNTPAHKKWKTVYPGNNQINIGVRIIPAPIGPVFSLMNLVPGFSTDNAHPITGAITRVVK
jgi:hypothetical protein